MTKDAIAKGSRAQFYQIPSTPSYINIGRTSVDFKCIGIIWDTEEQLNFYLDIH